MRKRLVSRTLNPLLTSLPPKFSQIYDYQVDAITEIVDCFDNGAKVVVLDAPTGSGKTLIAEIVRRMLETRACYVCHNKDLQTQFHSDFNYSKVLYGRSNYRPQKKQITDVTCEDCTQTADRSCPLCDSPGACPYQLAKRDAVKSPVPVLNSAYWLNETQHPRSRFANTGLVILDEADTMESVLMGQVEVYISERRQLQYSITPPAKLTKVETYGDWCDQTLALLQPDLDYLLTIDMPDLRQARELRRLAGLVETINSMKADLYNDSPWVYTGGAGSTKRRGQDISFKPVKVASFGKERIWNRDKRFLLMSATIVSPQQVLEGLGWTEDYGSVRVESQFHPRNRQVVVRPVANMTRKGATDESYSTLAGEIQRIVRSDAEQSRVLIHSVSYSLTARVVRDLGSLDRPVLSYRMASERSDAIRQYLLTDRAVLVAPSADRGVDLYGDRCRTQIICKLPFLSLGDKQTSERLYNTSDGGVWYNVEVARTLMQMVGRGVRNTEDWCTCYVLDSTWTRWYREWGHLFPKWFRKGIRVENV